MQKKQVFFLLIAFQVLILLGVFGKALYPLVIGEEVKFKVLPRDPRDIFRGNYVDLTYSFNNLDLLTLPNDIDKTAKYRYGDVFYLELAKKGDFHEPAGVWREKPENKQFMQVIFQDTYSYDTIQSMMVNAGIESYFTEAKNALKIESLNSRDSTDVIVNVMVAPDGKARIKDIEIRDKK